VSKPRHAKRSRSYTAVTAAAAVGVTGAALPFGLAYAATPAAPPAPAHQGTLSKGAVRLPAHRGARAAKIAGAARTALPARYLVQPGDTLSGIARRFCGNPGDYPALAANSGIADPDLILPGEVVRLACHAAAAAFAAHIAPPPADPKPVPVAHPVAAPVTDGVTATVTAAGGTLSCAGLEALWDAAGGNPGDAFMAAEIAMAESGGRQYALSPTQDVGYFQINESHGPGLATYNALGNAKAAVLISDDGTDWSAWTTYTEGLYEGRC
jgi:LysM repeat protein